MKWTSLIPGILFLLTFYSSFGTETRVAATAAISGFRGPATWYVDSRQGDDKYAGNRPEKAFQSLQRMQRVKLQPGDTIRFKRGSEFQGPFYVYASGNKSAYITLSDYGDETEPAPRFTNPVFVKHNYGNCIRIKGSYVVVENLFCHFTAAYVRGDYDHGFLTVWEMGAIYIDKGAEHCIVRNNEIEDCVVGIKSYGKHALIEGNYIHDCNRVLKEWGWGPIGIWFGEDYQEARHNRVFNYRAEDPRIRWDQGKGGGCDGGAFEIDDARINKSHIAIHHNFTRDCQGFLEVTWTDVKQHPVYRNFHIHHNISDDYQQFLAMWCGANARIEHNTIIRRKVNANDWGVFNITQDSARNLIANNIVITEKNIRIFNTGLEAPHKPENIICNNLYFAASGALDLGLEGPGRDPVFADPLLVNYQGTIPEHFSLQANSPAIDKGRVMIFGKDFTDARMPHLGEPDIGAFEYLPAGIPLAIKGKATVNICLPPTASVAQEFAGAELSKYLERITGAPFLLKRSGEIKGPAIRLESGNDPKEGYSITCSGEQVILWGSSERTLLYAVYDFLERLGCRWLAPDFDFYGSKAEFIPSRSTLYYAGPPLVKEQPVLAYRKLDIEEGLSHTSDNLKRLIEWMPKLRFNTLMIPLDYQGTGRVKWDNWRKELTPELKKRGLLIEVGGHGYQNFINPGMENGRLFDEHPDWFGKDKECRPSRENYLVFNTENAAAVAYFIRNVIQYLKQHPEIDIFDLWPPDEAHWADCPEWERLGTTEDRQARLLNRVDSALKPLFPSLKLEMIAYARALLPPRQVTVNPNVLVDFCPIDQLFERQIYDTLSSANKTYVEALRAWRMRFSGDLSIYSYYRKYAWRSLPNVIPHYMQRDLKWYASVPVQGISTYAEPGDWRTYELNHYVLGHLSWDPSVNMDSLISLFAWNRYGRFAPLAMSAWSLLEEVVPHYGNTRHTPVKPERILIRKRQEVENKMQEIRQARSIANSSMNTTLHALELMLQYAAKDLAVLETRAAGAPEEQFSRKVEDLLRFLRSNAEKGVFVITGREDASSFMRSYKRNPLAVQSTAE